MRAAFSQRVQGHVGDEDEAANVYPTQKRTPVGDRHDSVIVDVQTTTESHVLQIFTSGADGLDSDRRHLMRVTFRVAVQVQSTETLARRQRLDAIVVDGTRGKAERFGSIVD